MVKSDAGACACTYFAGVLYAENRNGYDYHLRRNSINVLPSHQTFLILRTLTFHTLDDRPAVGLTSCCDITAPSSL